MSNHDTGFAALFLASLITYFYGILFTWANPARSEPTRTWNRRLGMALFTFAYPALLIAFYIWTHPSPTPK